MPITARAATDKITELRSKLAIYAHWVEVIQANYMPQDGGPPETRIEREDGGHATEAHFQSVLDDVEHRCAELREELAEWENLVFEPVKLEEEEAEVHELEKRTKVARRAKA